jgi:hypothetical protein
VKVIHLESLRRMARQRGGTYLEDCLNAGRIEGDYLILDEKAHAALRRKHTPKQWGDQFHELLAPLVKGTRFENCRDCARRRDRLNKLGVRFGLLWAKAFRKPRQSA